MKTPLTIIKVGGKVVEEPSSLSGLLDEFCSLPGAKVLVHGGGRTATEVATRMGIETKMTGGRRITDEAMLEVVTMVYGGLVNKRIVAQLGARGLKALGLTGADMDVIRSHKRPVGEIDYGYAGDVDRVDSETLSLLISEGITPVMAPLTHDGHGQLLNTNADTIAGETAKALAQRFDVTLIYCFEKKGVLSNPDDDESVIAHIHTDDYARLRADGTIAGGMLPKLDNSFAALRAGVRRVIITKVGELTKPSGTIIEI